MFFNLDLNIKKETELKINDLINQKILEHIDNIGDKTINTLINEVLKGAIKSRVNEILQSENFRSILRDRIMKQLNMKDI